MKCERNHIEIPIPDEEWKCPRCDSEIYTESDNYMDCELYHSDDHVRCTKCDYEKTLSSHIKAYAKKKNIVKCECCGGKGWIQK